MRLAWSGPAKTELAEIRRTSIERWGRDVAIGYLQALRDAAKASAANPDRLRGLSGPYHVRRVRWHYLIIHVDPHVDSGAGRLTVARILHVRMDIERHLPGRDAGET